MFIDVLSESGAQREEIFPPAPPPRGQTKCGTVLRAVLAAGVK